MFFECLVLVPIQPTDAIERGSQLVLGATLPELPATLIGIFRE